MNEYDILALSIPLSWLAAIGLSMYGWLFESSLATALSTPALIVCLVLMVLGYVVLW